MTTTIEKITAAAKRFATLRTMRDATIAVTYRSGDAMAKAKAFFMVIDEIRLGEEACNQILKRIREQLLYGIIMQSDPDEKTFGELREWLNQEIKSATGLRLERMVKEMDPFTPGSQSSIDFGFVKTVFFTTANEYAKKAGLQEALNMLEQD